MISLKVHESYSSYGAFPRCCTQDSTSSYQSHLNTSLRSIRFYFLIDLAVITWFHSILNTFSLLIVVFLLQYILLYFTSDYTICHLYCIASILHCFIIMSLRSTIREQLIFSSPLHSKA